MGAKSLTACLVSAAALATAAPAAHADGITIGADGKTAPVFSYQDATRERVFIPVAGVDQDNDGTDDRVAVDIIRPKESGPNLKVPAIIDDSPYYTSVGRGNEGQFIHTTAAGALDKFPLFYDNYFVPRGYAVILAQAIGTAFSTGCPLHGGPGDVAGFKAVIDWTEGRVPGYTTVNGTTPVTAGWSNGKNAMIGKSYDGTFANGVAATGVDGLTTIVPISAISDWYDYSRMGGIRFNTHYPHSLDNSITRDRTASTLGVVPPVDHRAACANVFSGLDQVDGDTDGDVNQFWQDRNYNLDVNKVKAAVFASHGIDDDNVRPNHFSQWWAGLAANNVPRKAWLSQEGHVDPFEYRRGAWVDTLHRWFDHWLQGVENGIMNEPRVDIEQPQGDVWSTYADFPIPGTAMTDVFLGGRSAGTSGSLGLASGGATDTLSFVDDNPSQNTAQNDPNGSQANRLVFLSPKLTKDVHISGEPVIDIQASLSTTQSNLAALLVDYGPYSRVGRGGADGVTETSERTCWGENSVDADNNVLDSACYLEVTKPVQSGFAWNVSKGILDSSNRDSLFTGQSSPVTVGQKYEFKFPVLPTDYTFPAGHQIGVVLVANFSRFRSVAGTPGATVAVDTKRSKVILPVTGGGAAVDAAGVAPDTTAPAIAAMAPIDVLSDSADGEAVTFANPSATDTQDADPAVGCAPASGSTFAVGTTRVTCTATDANGNATSTAFDVTVRYAAQQGGGAGGTVPATLALTLGTPASFGTFTPGVTHDYVASMTANVLSTAGDALLSVTDSDVNAASAGHLVNGAFVMPQPLQARARNAMNTGTAFNNVGSSLNLLTWSAPISNDAVSLEFSQRVNGNDALRTGTYGKTLTFTLSTTNP